MFGGWIKLHRQLLNSDKFKNEKLLKVFIWCLLKASHKECEQRVGRQAVHLMPGQFVFGRNAAAIELQMSPSTVYDYILLLKSDRTISIKTGSKFSVVTVANWEVYQSDDENSGSKNGSKNSSKSDSKSAANRQQIDINKKKRNKEDINIYSPSGKPSGHADVIVYFTDKYQDAYNAKYLFSKEKDGAAVKRLLQTYDVETIKQLIDTYFDFSDDYVETNGRTISHFAASSTIAKCQAIAKRQESRLATGGVLSW